MRENQQTCKRKFIISLFTIAPNYKQNKCLTVGEWVTMVYAHSGIIHRNTKDKLLLELYEHKLISQAKY